jgi:uncharacterized coiled-coil protein SlyX
MPEVAALKIRADHLESRQSHHATRLETHDESLGQQAVTIAKHDERLDGLDEAVGRLADTVNKGVWALIGFSFTIAASAVGLALTLSNTAP